MSNTASKGPTYLKEPVLGYAIIVKRLYNLCAVLVNSIIPSVVIICGNESLELHMNIKGFIAQATLSFQIKLSGVL